VRFWREVAPRASVCVLAIGGITRSITLPKGRVDAAIGADFCVLACLSITLRQRLPEGP
jgi:hypothetical protein